MSNPNGRFGVHGGQYIPETLMNAVIELEAAYNEAKADPAFNAELTALFNDYAGRPSRLYFAKRMTENLGGAKMAARRSISSARISTTPAPTRSTTCSARPFWPNAWEKRASSPRPAPASTAWPQPPPPL